MFTSASKKEIKTENITGLLKTSLAYLLISIVLAAAGAVYEHFSFGVYSNYMIYAFAFPLIGGALPYMLCAIRADRSVKREGFSVIKGKMIGRWTYHAAVATLTVGSIMQGILAICGRPNSLVMVYPAAAAVLLAAAVIVTIRPARMAGQPE